MIRKRIGILATLFCICVLLLQMPAKAVSTSDAKEPIMPERECALTITYCYGDIAFSDLQVRLYRIAEVSADYQYTLTSSFAASGLILNGIQTTGEWDVVRATLEAHILANRIDPDGVAATDDKGSVTFASLKTGLYLAVVSDAVFGDLHFCFDSALVLLPGLGQDGLWQYDVSVNAKGEVLPPIDPDGETEYKVIKLWKGDEGQQSRPQSIEVEIYRNGVILETVILSEENHWALSWLAEDDGSTWMVVERNVPEGYTMTLEERGTSFILTNTWTPTEPDDPVNPPQTGDTSNLLLYILAMAASGSMLILLGVAGKRRMV